MKTSFKKAAYLILASLVISVFLLVRPGQTKIQPYYSGDAAYFHGQLLVSTTNTGYLEIFKLSGNTLDRLVRVKINNPAYNNFVDFSDSKLSIENDHLYIYAISQYTVYKYDFSDLSNLNLLIQRSNTYWNWYDRVDRFGDNIGLVGKKGVDILDSDLQVINSYSFLPKEVYGLRSNGSNDYFFGISNGYIQVYDRLSRSLAGSIMLNFKYDNSNHKIFFDQTDNTIYAVDDYYAKKFSIDGKLLASFHHLDAAGYDFESAAGNPDVYFSNGLGIVKLDKNLKLKGYAYTTNLGGPQGWAMGLKYVNTDSGDRLVVFNSSNILVLDSNLKKISSYKATDEETPAATEALFINYSNNSGLPGATIGLNGGGYWPGENLVITIGTQTSSATADSRGRFKTNLTVPNLTPQRLDIKVKGENSGLSYSTSFEIK